MQNDVLEKEKMAEECKEGVSRICPVSRILPNGEFTEFVREQRKVNQEVHDIHMEMPKKNNNGAIIITLILYAIGIIFLTGAAYNTISDNSKMVEKIDEKVDNNVVSIAKLEAMHEDIKWIKQELIAEHNKDN